MCETDGNSTTPDVLYKYRSWNDLNHKKVITNNEIFFASPGRFNDPFDCSIPVRIDKAKNRDVFKYIEEVLAKREPHLSRKERREKAREIKLEKHYKDIELQSEIQGEIMESKNGIFTLSAEYKDIKMWSHYADSHNGFCIGFNVSNLPIEGMTEKIVGVDGRPIIFELLKVKYEKEYPYFDMINMDLEERMILPLITKSIDWIYEQEYRLLAYGGPDIVMRLADNAINRIILGCKMDDDTVDEIIEVVDNKTHPITILRAKKKTEEFGLDFVELGIYGNASGDIE